MQNVQFDPLGGTLNIQIIYKGNMTVSYNYTLWGSNSNGIVSEHAGNNQNDQDDSYDLPNPVQSNEGRIIDIFSTIRNSDTESQKEIVNIKIFQGTKKIADFSEEEIVEANKTIINEIFIKLITT